MAVEAIKSVKTEEIKEGSGKNVARYPVSVIYIVEEFFSFYLYFS